MNGRAIQYVNAALWTEREKKRVLDSAVRSVGHPVILSNELLPDMMLLTMDDLKKDAAYQMRWQVLNGAVKQGLFFCEGTAVPGYNN